MPVTLNSSGILIDVCRHKLHNFVPQRMVGIQMLQSGENRNHLVSAFIIEREFRDWGTIESALPLAMLSHGDPSLKIFV